MGLDTSKIIHAPIGGGKYTVTSPLTKSDYGIMLVIENAELPTSYQVDFSNNEHSGTSLTRIGGADGVEIPKQFIDTGKDVFAWLYWVGEDYGKTVYKFRIPNHCRPDRTNEEPTPEEQSVIDQAISALNSAVAQTAQDVIDADQSAQDSASSAQDSASSALSASDSAERASASATSASNSANSASASATASAQSAQSAEQTKTEVDGMVDDAQGYASASAQSATASANSASQASSSATSASQSASSAQGYASSAQTSANTASAKATEASTSASTASAKATESAQSASQALTYKTDAESAKTASQTAQGLAEGARDSAISAKESAEDARDEAQSIVDGISAKAEQIDANTASIASLTKDKAPVITDTASGSIASFSDGADDLPLKSLVVNIDPVQDTSSGDPSPENICPISGWTQVDVEQSGVNVWDEEWEIGALIITTGLNTADVGCFRSKNYLQLIPNATYFVHGTAIRFCFYDADKNFVESPSSFTNTTFTVPSNVAYGRFYKRVSPTVYSNDISINYPSTDQDYHPYTGRSITIDLGQTVYGAWIDVLSGVMRVDRLGLDGGDLSWAKVDSYNYGNFYVLPTPLASYVSTRPTVISSSYKSESNQTASSTNDCYVWIRSVSSSNRRIYVKDTSKASMTAEEFRTAMTGVQFVYELAEPIEIQLDAHTLNSLYGQNNIFADTGDAACEYRADTTLYISRLTEPDADMVADSNIVSGQYFMVGNNLYLATANIASGGQVIVGANATRKSLSEALNEINA